MRHRFALLHRWVALILSPFFVLLLATGILLAFRPLVHPPRNAAAVDPAKVVSLLAKAPPTVRFAGMEDDGRTLTFVEGRDHQTSFDLESGARVATPPAESSDFFGTVEHLHTDIWRGLGWIVGLATFAMALLVISGPFLRPLRKAPPNALGWHIKMGWLAWPLVAMLPLTIGLEKLHPPINIDRTAPKVALADAFQRAAAGGDVRTLRFVAAIPGGAIVNTGAARFLVDQKGVHKLDTAASSLGKTLHEGTWGEPAGAFVSILAALGLGWMLFTGLSYWWRYRRAT